MCLYQSTESKSTPGPCEANVHIFGRQVLGGKVTYTQTRASERMLMLTVMVSFLCACLSVTAGY